MRNRRLWTLIIIMAIAIALMIGATTYILIKRQSREQPNTTQNIAAVSGTFNINGVIKSNASARILKKSYGTAQGMEVAVENTSIVDQGTWDIPGLVAGNSYELVAEVIENGRVTAVSSPLFVTAPANNETFEFNIVQNDSEAPAMISGVVQINGYIPEQATFTILGRKLGDSLFEVITPYTPAKEKNVFTHTVSRSGTPYELFALLNDSYFSRIGQSSVLSLTAPASNELFTINSTAIMPPKTVTPQPTSPSSNGATPIPTPTVAPVAITGSINFNGNALYNSRIVILQKVYNTSTYAVAVDNLSPIDGISWSWSNPSPSTWYDLIAVLKQKQSDGTDRDIAVSAIKSVAAPATNTVLTLNSNILLPSPNGEIKVVCMDQVNSVWNAQVVFGSVDNAKKYWMQVGTKSGEADTANVTQNSSGSSEQRINVKLKKQTPFYARYAYAVVENVATASSQFSPFSSPTQIQCN